jgi:hypothetical protein
MKAHEIAAKAAELVAGDRDRQHGQKKDNFDRIAKLWGAYMTIRRSGMAPLDAIDVGHMMVLMKIARTQSGAVNPDDYVDAAGYAACAGEIATRDAYGHFLFDEEKDDIPDPDLQWEKAKKAREAIDTV